MTTHKTLSLHVTEIARNGDSFRVRGTIDGQPVTLIGYAELPADRNEPICAHCGEPITKDHPYMHQAWIHVATDARHCTPVRSGGPLAELEEVLPDDGDSR